MKKIWLLLLSLSIVFWFWVSFANPIAPETYYVCSMFENVEIDNYRVIVQNGSSFYEPTVKTCSQCWEYQNRNHDADSEKQIIRDRSYFGDWGPTQEVFLLDKATNLGDITTDNVDVKAISIWSITSTFCDISHNKTRMYKVVNSWGNYVMLNRTQHYKDIQEMKNKIKKVPLFRLLTIITETIVLFLIAKIFRKDEEISNKKLLLLWIIPTTITLPLLWFLLPLLLWNWTLYLIIWELLVVAIEMIIIKYWLKISRIKAIIASLLCNLFSFVLLTDEIRQIWMSSLLVILIETIALFIVGKLLLKKYEISNKKFILVWSIASTLSLILIRVFIRVVEEYSSIYLQDRLTSLIIIWIKIFSEIFIIKYLLRISWTKTIIVCILCNITLCVFWGLIIHLLNLLY